MYGVAALRAAARGDRMMWALHRAALSNGIVPVVPAPVVAEGFRTEVRGDYLRALLAGSEVEVLEEDGAERLGGLAARAGTGDLVSASVAECAATPQRGRRGRQAALPADVERAARVRPRPLRGVRGAAAVWMAATCSGEAGHPAQRLA